MTRTVLFILSLGHSGSTLLGYYLGAHSHILHTGEIPAPMRRNRPFRCHYCGDDPCPIWGGAVDESLVRNTYQTSLACRYEQSRWRRYGQTLIRKICNRYVGPGVMFDRIFQALPEIQVIVDGSKDIDWTRWHQRSTNYHSKFILLTRDLRAACLSEMRFTPDKSMTEIAQANAKRLERFAWYAGKQPAEDVCKVTYEQLVQNPEQTGRTLCEFLGLSFEPAMLNYHDFPNHVIGGNPGPTVQARNKDGKTSNHLISMMGDKQKNYYNQNRHTAQPGFRFDERWRRELSPQALEEFEQAAGRINRTYGYVD